MIASFIIPALMSIGWRAKMYLSLAGAVLLSLGMAFIMGRSAGKEAYAKQREKARQAASTKAENIRHEIGKAPGADVDRRLDRWMRD